uniref:Uncharacterized protein n=1 Tax=Knipowitschia caucasica TaxID=637954 RepID=A0AAV2LRT5_KNICA
MLRQDWSVRRPPASDWPSASDANADGQIEFKFRSRTKHSRAAMISSLTLVPQQPGPGTEYTGSQLEPPPQTPAPYGSVCVMTCSVE